MAAGASPAQSGRRRRGHGWTQTPKESPPPRSSSPASSSRAPTSSGREPPPAFLSPGAAVEVRIDGDSFYGSWFEATVHALAPARGGRSTARAWCTVTYAHLLPDDDGAAALTESVPASHVRPRPPPPPSPPRFLLHDIVEAFHRGGWWSGLVVGPEPAPNPASLVSVAFPITREVAAFDPRFVRPRRDYVGGEWVPSRAVIAVRPNDSRRVYAVGDAVEVVREREAYGCSWFAATVAKAVDKLSYIVEYIDHEERDDDGAVKKTEYLDEHHIRPAVKHSWPTEGGFQLEPGAAVEAYCDGAWSRGVVHRVVGDREFEVSIDAKVKQVVTKAVELLRPQYRWNGRFLSIVSAKKQDNLRRQSASGKHRSLPVELSFSDDEHSNDPSYSRVKKSRKELQQQEIVLAPDSENASVSEKDILLSALCKSPESNHSPQHGQSTPPKKTIPNVGATGINEEIPSNMVLSQSKGGETVLMQAPLEEIDASGDVHIHLKENVSICRKDINCALSASMELHTTSVLEQQMSTGKSNGSNTKVYISKKSAMRKDILGPKTPEMSLNVTSAVQNRGRKKAAGRKKESSPRKFEGAKFQTQQQHDRSLDDTLNMNNKLSQMVPPGFESMYNRKGFNILSLVLGKKMTSTIDGIFQARNARVIDSAATQASESNCLIETSTILLDHLVQQDGGNMNDRAVLLGLQDAGSSQCPLVNCSVAETAMPSQLSVSQISGHQALFIKSSQLWPVLEAMHVFKNVPQQPHFRPLQRFPPALREEMALGLMSTFASSVENIRTLSLSDSMDSFEGKINTLCILEENGFNVEPYQNYLIRLKQIKIDNTSHHEEKDSLKAQILDKMTNMSRMDVSLDENCKAIAELEKKLWQLRNEGQKIAKKKELEGEELSTLKAADNSLEEACIEDQQKFRGILAELQRVHLT